MNKGGLRQGAGRKPKAKELELIEKLTPLEESAFKALEKGVKAGEFQFIKLFFAYRFGQPKQQLDDIESELPSPIIVMWGGENNQK